MRLTRAIVVLVIALVVAVPSHRALGQVTGRPKTRTEIADSIERKASRADTMTAAPVVLDRPVNRKEYDLGPGDVLDVAFFGELTDQYTITVGPEGAAVIPKVGVANVLGANIEEAESRIRTLVNEFYRKVDVRVNLSRVRTFKVFVIGNVEDPGTRVATAVTRVSEVTPPSTAGVYYRNVVVRRANGDTVQLDLARFFQTGDLSVNPTLRGGDAVVVPFIDRTVNIYGRVAFPGTYEFRANESLAEFLRVVNGGGDFPANAADTVQITRFTSPGTREFTKLSRAEAMGARGRGLILQPFDAVYIPAIANYKEQKVATVTGQVRRPGTYPIRPDTTTVRELVEMAGGLTPQAALTAASLRRLIWVVVREAGQTTAADSTLARDERYARHTTVELQDTAFVSIEFDRLFAEGKDAANERLQNEDRLAIPFRQNHVVIFGAVIKPGIVAYHDTWTLADYIREAGGYSNRAEKRDVALVRAGTGGRILAKDIQRIEPGDQLVVPFGVRTTFAQRLQVIGTVVGVVANTVLTVYTVRTIFRQ